MSPGFWRRIAKLSALPKDITKHVFRHTFSSIGNDLRCTEATIGAIVGHKGRTQTSQYIHSVDAVLLAEADRIADHIVGLMDVGMGQGAETECEPALYNVITP
jgi:integrase